MKTESIRWHTDVGKRVVFTLTTSDPEAPAQTVYDIEAQGIDGPDGARLCRALDRAFDGAFERGRAAGADECLGGLDGTEGLLTLIRWWWDMRGSR